MKRIALAILLTVSMLGINAQTIPKFDVKNLVATSPEAAMIGRFGDIPIGYYTGTADVSIPLATVKEGGVEIPIVLRYHGSGIKVEDQASNVGLGWSLEPGGGIVQIVTGKNDATDLLSSRSGYNFLRGSLAQGVYAERHEIGNAYFSWNCYTLVEDQMDDYQILDGMAQGMGQPDLYQYNFAGYSGKFYINPITSEIVLMDKKSDIKFSGGNGGWVAKTMDGNTFYFYGYENVTNYEDGSASSGQTAKLTKIELHNGKTINFGYQDGYYTTKQYSESLHSDYPLTYAAETNNRLMPNLSTMNHQVKMLTTITSDNDIINFNLEDRLDMPAYMLSNNQPVKRIGSVDIKNAQSGRLMKSYRFNYDYFNRSNVGGSFTYLPQGGNSTPAADDSKALKLLSVQEIGYTAAGQQVANPPYTFNYNESVLLPMKTSFAKDFWGYYNGQENRKSIPDLNFFYLSGDPDYSDVSPNLLSSFQGANRAPDSTKMKAGILTRITYPTGGYTEFDYEPHNFTNYSYPDVTKSQQSIQSGRAQDNNQSYDHKSLSFTLPKTQAVTFNNSINRGPVARTYMDMQPATIVLTKTENGITSTVRIWQMDLGDEANFNSSGVKNWQTSLVLPYIANGQYTITTYLPDEFGPQQIFPDYATVTSDFIYYVATETAKVSYGGGLRVSGIRNYLAHGEPSGRKAIKYVNADNTPSGILMTPVKPLYSNIIYAIQAGVTNNAIADQKKVWHISSESSVPFSDAAQGNVVGYSRVEETELAPDGTTKGRHIYIYNNRQSDFRVNLPENPDLLNGMIKTEEIYNNSSAVPIQKTTYGYSLLEISTFSGYKIESTFVGDRSVSGCLIWNNDGQHVATIDYQHMYMLHGYPLTSNWYMLGSKTTELNNNGTTVSTTSNYSYNAKGQVIKLDTYNSRNQKKTSNSLFPVDNPSDPMSASLISRNLYDHIQQQTEVLNDATELSKSTVNYRIENDQAVQSNISHSYQQGTPFTEVTFDKYGPHETLQQFTKNGPSTCVLWSYNYSKPIAKINNVSFATLESVLGAAAIDSFAARLNPSKADIDAFLAPISNLFITRYVYDPATGITSETDPKGKTTYYEYDGMQRLKAVKDQDGNILKSTDYHYAVPGNDTQVPYIYLSTAVSRTFTRNNCTEGGIPGTYTYTIPKGVYTSTISQDDADAKAISLANSNGQTMANSNAGCTFSNVVLTQIFTKNNCASGGIAGTYTYTIPAGSYTSTIGPDDAQSQAQNAMNANGQAAANANAICTFKNDAMNQVFKSNLCTGAEVPSDYNYVIPAGKYTSTLSLNDANAQARADLAANGQAMANSNGSCNCTGEMNKRIGGYCQTGTRVTTNSEYNSRGRYYVCTYHYEWSDGSRGEDLTEQNSNPCPVN